MSCPIPELRPRLALGAAALLAACTAAKPPPAPLLSAPPQAVESPSGRSRAHALEGELAAAAGDHHAAAHALERAVFEDPGSAALLLRWGEAALRAGDAAQLTAAAARAARGGHHPAVPAALAAMRAVGSGAEAQAALEGFAAAHPPDSPEASAAGVALRQALAPGSPLARACAREPAPWACLARAPTAALDEALRLSAAADPILRLWLAERRWVEAEAPTGQALRDTLDAAEAAGDATRLRCWSARAPQGPLPPPVGAPAPPAPPPAEARAAMEAALRGSAPRWASCAAAAGAQLPRPEVDDPPAVR